MLKAPPYKIKYKYIVVPFYLIYAVSILFGCATEKKKHDSVVSKSTTTNNDSRSTSKKSTNYVQRTLQPFTNEVSTALQCGGKDLGNQVKYFAALHTGIAYNVKDRSTQCSGIFQRVLQSVRDYCPDAIKRTPPPSAVDSRSQGKWYYDHNALTLINDPIASADLIRPGMVMFYGRKKQAFYKKFSPEILWSPREGIRHVGVVVDVERDAYGILQSYSLFHGRRPGIESGISKGDNYMHRRVSKENAPAFGNGPDAWVAVAPIVLQEKP